MDATSLSYEDVPYDEQVAQNLKDRLGKTKVYLYEDVAKATKVKSIVFFSLKCMY